MKYIILSFLTIFYTVHSMQEQLGTIEKEIFLREVDRIGKKAALEKIKRTKDPQFVSNSQFIGVTKYPCFIIITQVRRESDDPLAQKVFDIIDNKKEETSLKNSESMYLISMKNNFIENFTTYSHKQDQNGKYIKLKSRFNDKESLLDILNNQ